MVVTKSFPKFVSLGVVGIIFLAARAPTRATEVMAGSAVLFSVTVNGTGPFSYQWRRGGANLAGATAETYKVASVQAGDAGDYTVVVSNKAGSTTSDTATLTLPPAIAPVPPAIVIQNSNQIVTTGHAVSLTAGSAADGGQWQVSSDSGTTWSSLAGDATYRNVNSATLDITGVSPAMGDDRYRYVIAGSTSNAALLTVAPALFSFPVGIAADSSGNLYVSDTATDTIQRISTGGTVNLLAGLSGQTGTADGSGSGARFNDPSGVAAAAAGTLSVADCANGTIRQITPAGLVGTLAGSTTFRGNADGPGAAATFSSPLGLAWDGGGNLYVTDTLNNTIRKVSPGGTVSTLAGNAGAAGNADGMGSAARFNHPTGIAVDGAGTVCVADATNNLIRKITPAGVVTTLAGLPGVSGSEDGPGSIALFNNPGGLAIDGSGNLYVSDTGNSTIRKITPAGVVTTIAGLPGIAGLRDGTGMAAWFNQPQGLVLDPAGNLYVADTGNAAIRKITPAGVVATVALSVGPTPVGSTSGSTPASTTTASSSTGAGATSATNVGATPVSEAGASSTPGGGSSGGGALDAWFAGVLSLAGLLRLILSRR